ncbi:MAG: FtsX-like permease family protein [Propionibacteriaceae bacterium]
MLREPRRLIASIIAIAVGIGFAAATFFLSASLEKSINTQMAGAAADAAVVVSPGNSGQMITPAMVKAFRAVPGVTQVRADAYGYYEQKTSKGSQFIVLRQMPSGSDTKVVEGRLPAAKGEIALTDSFAKDRKLGLGATVEIYSPDRAETATLTVVGIVVPGQEYAGDPSNSWAIATDADLFRWNVDGMNGYAYAYLFGGDADTMKKSVAGMSDVKAAELKVQSGAEYLADQRKSIKDALDMVTNFLLGFAGVALFVGALVIANTFSILVAQRARQLALLRCVGATRSQVFRTVLGEALLMGVVGGVLGVIGGGVFAFALVQIGKAAKLGLDEFAITPTGVLVPLAIAVAITLFAAFRPALRATRVSPLAALQPQLVPVTGRRASLPVLIAGAVLFLAGLAGLLYGAIKPGYTDAGATNFVIVGIVGGVLNVVGVLMLGTILVPALSRLIGVIPARLGGVPGQLAVENSRRNPSRATATASALLIGVTLITMATVGAATGSATQELAMDKMFPSDLTVQSPEGLSDSTIERIRKVSVVAAAAKVVQIGADVGSLKGIGVAGMDPTARDVLRYPAYIDGLADDTIIVPKDMKIANGTSISVVGDKGSLTLRVVVLPASPSYPVVTLTNAQKLSAMIQGQAWLKLTDTSNPDSKIEAITSELQDVQGIQVTGGIVQRQQIQQILNIVLAVVIGLLAASVLVAIVGISNTLGLSVLERTRESALLRALGLTRGQLRGMFGIEAMVLAGVGVLLGIGLGIGYGIAGSLALLAQQVSTVVVSVPWFMLLGILAFGLGAGWLASVLPSVRAGKVQPAAALAAE